MSKEVFVSYTSADKACAFSIVEFLEKAGVECFIAPRNIDAGRPYASNIMSAIEECKMVVLVSSAAINKSEHVLNEVDVTFSKKKKIIPFYIEEFELNDDLRYYIGRKQRIIAYPEKTESYFPKLLDALLPEVKTKDKVTEKKSVAGLKHQTVKKLEYIPERGIIINAEDRQRNVSFRTDTLVSIFSEIYGAIRELSGDVDAKKIFFDAGYKSGVNFAQRLFNQWNNECISMEEKLEKWCQFDSSVGWGKFDVDITIDRERDCLTGELRINECFIVDKRVNCEICSFIKGYCTGIIEIICGNVGIELECIECPIKSRFKSACVFKIMMKDA